MLSLNTLTLSRCTGLKPCWCQPHHGLLDSLEERMCFILTLSLQLYSGFLAYGCHLFTMGPPGCVCMWLSSANESRVSCITLELAFPLASSSSDPIRISSEESHDLFFYYVHPTNNHLRPILWIKAFTPDVFLVNNFSTIFFKCLMAKWLYLVLEFFWFANDVMKELEKWCQCICKSMVKGPVD